MCDHRLIIKGYKKNLEETDVWLPNPRDTTKISAPKLQQAWQEELNQSHSQSVFVDFRILNNLSVELMSVYPGTGV